MKKRFFMIGLLLLTLAACSGKGYKAKNETTIDTDHEFAMEYSSFAGTRQKTFSIPEKTTVEITTESISGKLKLKIEDNSGNVYFNSENGLFASQSVVLERSGTYTILVEGDGHHGNFSVRW